MLPAKYHAFGQLLNSREVLIRPELKTGTGYPLPRFLRKDVKLKGIQSALMQGCYSKGVKAEFKT
jgi:hypothetical protein